MLTISHSVLVVVWNQVTGLREALAGVEVLSWEVQGTLTVPKKLLQSRGAIASQQTLGMEWMHNSACSWATEVGRTPSAATVPPAMQGKHMLAHDAMDGGAENLRKGSAGQAIFFGFCCRIQSEVISKAHTAVVNKVGPTLVGYMDSDSRVTTCRLERPVELPAADVGAGVADAAKTLCELMEADLQVSGKGSPSGVVQHPAGSPTVGAVRAAADVGVGNEGSLVGRRRVTSGFPSFLKQSVQSSAEGAVAVEEVVVVGTCVCCYLSRLGHDARSRIGSTACVQVGGSFRKLGCQGVVQRSDRTSGMWALPRVWRRERFIVKRAPCRRPCTYLDRQQPDRRPGASYSYVDVKRRRSDSDSGTGES